MKLEFFFERENIQSENIPLTRLRDFVTPLPDNSQTQSTDILDNKKGNEPDKTDYLVNLVPEPSSSDSSSKTSSLDSRSKKKKHDKKKKRRNHRQTHLRVTIMILSMTVITDANDKKRRTIIKKLSNQIMRTFNSKSDDDSV